MTEVSKPPRAISRTKLLHIRNSEKSGTQGKVYKNENHEISRLKKSNTNEEQERGDKAP